MILTQAASRWDCCRCVNRSWMNGQYAVDLPAGGLIVHA